VAHGQDEHRKTPAHFLPHPPSVSFASSVVNPHPHAKD
jgi:hypothetical protein